MEKALAIIVVIIIGGLFYQETPIVKPILACEHKVIPKVIEKWAVETSPHSAISVERVNEVIEILQEEGLSKQGTAYLTGNFIAESYLIPCGKFGDGGLAQGLAQWHPGRRVDMPCELKEQIKWALNVEMPRDAGRNYPNLANTLKDATATPEMIAVGLRSWERWGIEGNRRMYGENIYNQL